MAQTEEFSFEEEYDPQERKTVIYLVMSMTEALKTIPKFLRDFQCLQHWAIGCDFGNRAVLYEINGRKEKNDKPVPIKPSWRNWDIGSTKNVFTYVIELGTAQLSPKRLRDLAAKNSFNRKEYDPINKNCQDWVEWLLNAIDPKLKKAMYDKGVRKVKDTFTGFIASSGRSSGSGSFS